MTRSQFETRILPVSSSLYRFAFRFLSNREEAEDTVQEILIKLWNMRERLGEYRNIDALAMTMTRNHCLDILRKRTRNYPEDISPDETRTAGQDPDREYDLKETVSYVVDIINDLPENYRSVIELRDIEGHEYDHIAELLGTNVNMLRVTLSRARKMIREKMKKYYEQEGTGNITGKIL